MIRSLCFGLGLTLGLSASCSGGVRGCLAHQSEHDSSHVKSPAPSLWKSARVHSTCATPSPHSATDPLLRFCEHELIVEGADAQRVISLRSESCDPSDTACVKRIEERKTQLCAAPDGHAIGFSLDGATWYVVALDAGEYPLHFRHRTFAASAANLWASVPSTRELVGDLLEGTASRTPQEMRGAASYVSLHPEDAALHAPLLNAIFGPPGQPSNVGFDGSMEDGYWQSVADAMGASARVDDNIRSRLLAILAEKETGDGNCCRMHRQPLAALALSNVADLQIQAALEALLSAHDRRDGDGCSHPVIVWSLARVTATLRSAPSDVLARFVRIAHENRPTPLRPEGTTSEEASSSVRALASLSAPEASAAVGEMASGPACIGMPSIAPPFRHYYADYSELFNAKTGPGPSDWRASPRCWAKLFVGAPRH